MNVGLFVILQAKSVCYILLRNVLNFTVKYRITHDSKQGRMYYGGVCRCDEIPADTKLILSLFSSLPYIKRLSLLKLAWGCSTVYLPGVWTQAHSNRTYRYCKVQLTLYAGGDSTSAACSRLKRNQVCLHVRGNLPVGRHANSTFLPCTSVCVSVV